MKKFCYKCRKQVAEKRLRIKGRFVTKQQAFDILGFSPDELKNNEIIQKLLESHSQGALSHPMIQLNSLVESEGGKKQIKIRNFQALIDDNYNHNSKTLSKLFNKEASFISTASSISSELSEAQEELLKQIHLNLRISTTKTLESNTAVS